MSEVQNVRIEDLSIDAIAATVREGLFAALSEQDQSSRPLVSQFARSVAESLGSVAGLLNQIKERDERIERLLKRIGGLEEAMRTLEEQSTITSDRLTGLLHSAHFLSTFEREFNESRRYNRPLSLLLIDLDSFGEINKTYGYKVGNKVLENVAKTLKD
ncbi:MAG: GGDEF domain-containing protein, partial [Bacteroidota bacterium]